MKQFLGVIGLLVLVSCAFRESQPTGLQPSLSVSLDWGVEPSALTLGKSLKNTRSLVTQGEHEFATVESTTLPVSAPKTLYVAVELPLLAESGSVEFMKTTFALEPSDSSIAPRAFEMVSHPVSEEVLNSGKRRVVVRVAGLNSAFPAERSQRGVLTLRFYSKRESIAQVQVSLRTPPSHLEMRHLHLREWLAEQGDVAIPLEQLEIDEKRLNLIRVVRVTNQERSRVELQIPRRPQAQFRQKTIGLTYQDHGCSFSIAEKQEWYTMGQEILILPLDSRLFTQAKESFSKQTPQDQLSLPVEAGGMVDLGVYATGEAADTWMSKGPLEPELTRQQVNNGCGRSCEETECYGGRGDVGMISSPASHTTTLISSAVFHSRSLRPKTGIRLASCHCSVWSNFRTTEAATLGINRLPVQLDVEASSRSWLVRFADLDFSLDSEIRSVPVLDASSQVVWK